MKDDKFVKDLLDLYNQGLSDAQIGQRLNVKEGTIFWWRHRKLKLAATKKVNFEKHKAYIINLINSKVPLKNICSKINCTPFSLRTYLKTLGFSDLRHLKKNDYKIGPREKSILVGTLLGDATVEKRNYQQYPRISLRHSLKQKQYIMYLYNNLRPLKPKLSTIKISGHTLNGRVILPTTQVELRLPSNKQFISLYDSFYKHNKKVIPFDLLFKYYNREALAIHFMDDGSKDIDSNGNIQGFIFSTNCFSLKELEEFKGFLLGKFGLHCTVIKSNHLIRVQRKSVNRFIYLVKPYITNDLIYKISSSKIS